MTYYRPEDSDAICDAQLRVLEAARAQLELGINRALKRSGVERPENPYTRPDITDPVLEGKWEQYQQQRHSLGGVHLGVLDEFNRRRRNAASSGVDHADVA